MMPDLTKVPERKLLVAVMSRALFDYVGQQADERKAAEDWFFDDPEANNAFSFPWVCNQLSLDRESVIARVKKMKRDSSVSTQQWFSEQQKAVGYYE